MSSHAPATWMVGAALLLASYAAAGSADSAPASVRVTVAERSGVARAGEAAVFGVPLPRAWNLADVSRLRLRDGAGRPVPAQFEALARWGAPPQQTSAPAKWVLTTALVSVAGGGTAAFDIDAEGPSPPSPAVIRIAHEPAGKITVDTGAARFEINASDNFNVLNQVTIGSTVLLEPLPARQAVFYRPMGTTAIVPGANPNTRARAIRATVERAGPLRAVVKVVGSVIGDAGSPVLDYTARLHFTAGRADCIVQLTVENNHPITADENGQPTNAHKQGSPNSVYVGDLGLRLRLRDTGKPLVVATEPDVSITAPKGPVRLYQDSSGTDFWNAYVGLVGWPDNKALAHPRLQSYCTKKGYEVTGPDIGAGKTGAQALGWMAAGRQGSDGPRVVVAVRDFWQNFPKAIEADALGTVTVSLFPRGEQFRHNLRVGEEKTHEVLLDFGVGAPRSAEALATAKAFNRPLWGVAPAAWYVGSQALGEVPVADPARWPLYEHYVRVAFEPSPEYDPAKHDSQFGNRTLRQVIEHYNLFGWQDYGDVPLDFEAAGDNQAGQMNLKYWYVHGMLLQFCRSADLRWLDLALPAARHLADIDYLHIPDDGPKHWAHGAYFGHSEHDEPGNVNPNRNANSPSVDLFFGVPDLLLAYYLTGDARLRDVALEGLESMAAMSQFSDMANPIIQRERANMIFAYVEGYRATGADRWLQELRKIVGPTADLSNKVWLTDPVAYGKQHPEDFLSVFSFSQTAWAMGRYLDFCHEYGRTDDFKVAEALRVFADFLLKHAKKEFAPGRATTLNVIHFAGGGADTYLEINNWTLIMADLLAYAFKYTGQRRFLDEAAKFYATGTTDTAWQDDPPVYLTTKDLVNSLNWGLVYMNQSLRAGAAASAPPKGN